MSCIDCNDTSIPIGTPGIPGIPGTNGTDGDSLFEVGSGTDSIQTAGNGADASGFNAIAFGLDSLSSNEDTIAIGSSSNADTANSIAIGESAISLGLSGISIGTEAFAEGESSVSLGTGTGSSGDFTTALGSGANAIGENSVAIGRDAIANVENTTQLQGAIITRKDSGEGNPQLNFAGAEVTITTQEIDLKAAAGEYSFLIPLNARFFPDSVELVLTLVDGVGVTTQPTVRAGNNVVFDQISTAAAPAGAFVLGATYDRFKMATVANVAAISGKSALSAGVTIPATGGTIKGRFVFRGLLIENE